MGDVHFKNINIVINGETKASTRKRKKKRKSVMDAEKLQELKNFVQLCKSNPSILHHSSLSFFRDYLHSLGARISDSAESGKNEGVIDMGEDILESDVELDNSDVVQPDNEPPQQMGDSSVEVTEERRDSAQLLKSKATDAISEGKMEDAVNYLTEAIFLNPQSAILYATRASVFVKQNKPNAAIRDANAALKINPDSAKGYKARGLARAMLGLWEEAASDLHVASKIDFDEEIHLALKKVEPNVHKIEEHRRKYERLRKERELRKKELERKDKHGEHQDPGAVLKDGQVIQIHSISELEAKQKAATRASRLAVLYFTATWCGPCRYISPLYSSLATQYQKVVFLKIDIDEASDVATCWNISSVPTFFFVKNGKEVDKVVGADKSSLEKKIAQYAS